MEFGGAAKETFSSTFSQSFRPPFSKGGGNPKGGALWPPSADGGISFTLGAFGGLGAFARERPPRPLFLCSPGRWAASPMGRWPRRGRRGHSLSFCCLRPPCKIALKLLPLPFPGCRREGLSGPGPTAGLLSCAGKKVTKEARLGGLRRPPKNPREPPVETCGRSMPSSESVAQG